jgi:hypothetical protein
MSNDPKFNIPNLKSFLESLGITVEDVEKFCTPRSPLDLLMDKYDVARLNDYKNVSARENPVLAKPITSYSFPSHSGGSLMNQPMTYSQWSPITYIPMSNWPSLYSYVYGFQGETDSGADPSVPVESPHTKLKTKIANLGNVAPEKVANPTPQVPEKSPDYMHTLTGWRAWRVGWNMLQSIGTDSHWQPKQALKANCIHKTHSAPQAKCTCGFWSFKNLDILNEALSSYADTVTVVSTVEIWGRVIECEYGFRSEYAYPKELWLLEDKLEHLSWTYGVPVRRKAEVK